MQIAKLDERARTIDQVADNYLHLRYSTRNLRHRVDHLTHLPMGYHARQRTRKAVGLLSKRGSACKQRVRETR